VHHKKNSFYTNRREYFFIVRHASSVWNHLLYDVRIYTKRVFLCEFDHMFRIITYAIIHDILRYFTRDYFAKPLMHIREAPFKEASI